MQLLLFVYVMLQGFVPGEADSKAFLGDTIRFSVGNTQVVAVIREIRGDTLVVDGRVATDNVFNVYITGMRLSINAFVQGRIQVYSFGDVYAEGNSINIGGVILNNVRFSWTQEGLTGYGDVLFGDRLLSLYLYINNLNQWAATFQTPQLQVYNVTLTNFTLNISQGEIRGSANVSILQNSFQLQVGYDGYELYAEASDLNITYRELVIEDAYLRLGTSTGFVGNGKITLYGTYRANVEFAVNSNSYIQITDGYFVIRGIEISDFYGYVGNNRYEIRGKVYLYGTELILSLVYVDNLGEPEFQFAVASSELYIGNVRIYNLSLNLSSSQGIYGYGYVKFNNISNPPSGSVRVFFKSDRSGNIQIGITDGYVVLSNGGVISNLTAYITSTGFYGYGTYRQGGSDVTVLFYSNNGTVSWQISGDALVFGGILLRHYYVGSDGRAYAWWIISPSDSIYFEFNWAQRYATVVYPCTFIYGNVTVYNLSGTIYADSGFIGTGYVRIGDQNNYMIVPIQFRSSPTGLLFGKFPNYLDLPDGQGIVVRIYDIEVVITRDGIFGTGKVNLENLNFELEFVASYGGYVNGTIRNGYINLGSIVITDLTLQLYPFFAAGWIRVPEFNGGIYVILKASSSAGLAVYVPGFDFYVNGFHIFGAFNYVNGSLFFQGGIEIPGGAQGIVDYLYVSGNGIDSCSITLSNITINGFRIVTANGRFARNPDRISLSGVFDLSQLSGFIGVSQITFQNLQISPDGRFLGCDLVGIQNFHIGEYFAFSGEFGFFDRYLVIYFAQIDFSNLSDVYGRVTLQNVSISYDGHIISASAIGLDYLHIGPFFASGWIYFLTNGASITGRVELRNIGYVYVRDLVITPNGSVVNVGEAQASFQIGGYGFTGSLSFPAVGEIYFSGSVRLPIFISGDASGSIHLRWVGENQGVLGTGYEVLAGSLSIPDFMMGGYHFLGGSFAFDQVGVSGRARINVPEVCEVELRLSFNWDGTFNYAYLAATGMNIPIGATGLFINGVGGGVYHYLSPYEYWVFVLWGLVSDPVRALALDATLEIATDGRVSGLGHLMIARYTWASAGFDVYTRLGYLDAYGWLGEDPSEGISFWGCYIRGQDSIYYNWVNVDAWGRGNLSASVWFVRFDAWFGFAYSLPSYPFVYGPYWRQRLYNDGIGASGLALGYLAGINVVWNNVRNRFDYEVWWGPVDQMNPGNAPYVGDMIFVGPYARNDINFDFVGGEEYVRPYDTYDAPGGFVWTVVNADNEGYFNFNTFGNSGVVYAGLYIHSDSARNVFLRYGIAGEYKIFVDGTVVNASVSSYAQPDQYTLNIALGPGEWKFVMFKVRKAYDQWGLYLRVTDQNGNVPNGISYQPNRPDMVVVYHDRGLTFEPFRFERVQNVQVEAGKFVLRSEGRPLWGTYLKDMVHYPRLNFPSFKVNFMLNGTARNDSTLIIMCDSSRTRYYGILFYYPTAKDDGELTGEVMGGGEKTGVKTSFYVGRWYTLEFVFEPESLYVFAYDFGRARPLRPLFAFRLAGDWDPSFLATVGGSDNMLYLDNYAVRCDWQSKEVAGIETPHPYPNNANLTWVVKQPGASFIRLHFAEFRTELFDTLYIKDKWDRVWFAYNGNRGSFTTPPIPSDTIYLTFRSDPVGNEYGFRVDYIRSRLDVPFYYSTPLNIERWNIPNSYYYEYQISIPDAKAIKLCFNDFNMDPGDSLSSDWVILYDEWYNEYARYTGNLGTFFSVAIPGNVVRVAIQTNNVIQSYGFAIKYASYITNDYYGVEERRVEKQKFNSIVGNVLRLPLTVSYDGEIRVRIYDVTGRCVLEKSVLINRFSRDLDVKVDELRRGVYFVKIYSGEGEFGSVRFIKVE